ncbi:hypothetical protein PoB_007381000 [Plakobranchus ocellatus]|uniref:Uncharacterized protein n=1 Tax=Plakobranchus ocellatus TaxID=259542 RepID=A0AAV4DT29_9GAST|nr:hypothetical protein PoB_007381000 [Plakobranchus ocellatus]
MRVGRTLIVRKVMRKWVRVNISQSSICQAIAGQDESDAEDADSDTSGEEKAMLRNSTLHQMCGHRKMNTVEIYTFAHWQNLKAEYCQNSKERDPIY